MHLQIGRLLLANVSAAELPEKIFEIVEHLNLGRELVTDTELLKLAQLNLEAGKKAKYSTAYAAAIKYLPVGMELLSADIWQTQYNLTRSFIRTPATQNSRNIGGF